jgi:hypothetical protein
MCYEHNGNIGDIVKRMKNDINWMRVRGVVHFKLLFSSFTSSISLWIGVKNGTLFQLVFELIIVVLASMV